MLLLGSRGVKGGIQGKVGASRGSNSKDPKVRVRAGRVPAWEAEHSWQWPLSLYLT